MSASAPRSSALGTADGAACLLGRRTRSGSSGTSSGPPDVITVGLTPVWCEMHRPEPVLHCRPPYPTIPLPRPPSLGLRGPDPRQRQGRAGPPLPPALPDTRKLASGTVRAWRPLLGSCPSVSVTKPAGSYLDQRTPGSRPRLCGWPPVNGRGGQPANGVVDVSTRCGEERHWPDREHPPVRAIRAARPEYGPDQRKCPLPIRS
jgi:hypothetical protein